jgi:steroid 5-alpha reductase family enzyme
MAPLLIVADLFAALCAFTWIASLVTGDNSWVDRIWSIAPVAYVWVFAGFAGLRDPRLDAMAVLATLWGARLTFNFARKGGYSGGEDYRWPVLRSRMTYWQFQLFSLFFIVIYQNLLLVLITLPALTAFEQWSPRLGSLDALLIVLFLGLLVGDRLASNGTSSPGRRPRPRRGANRRRASCRRASFATRDIRTSSSSRRSGGCCSSSGLSRPDRCCSGR